jgi:deoxycytidine triphosphate deaminase
MAATSVLSDGTIRRLVAEGRVRIDPWDETMVQPASVDLRLGSSFRVFHNHRIGAIDLADPPKNLTEHVEIDDGESFVIHPGEFVLGRTQEYVELPNDVVARIEGKALALDTPVPTPDGWRTIGDLESGDWVFAPTGHEIPVTDVSEVMLGRPCREVTFSDGTTVVADAEHLWRVRTHDDPPHRRRTLTTDQIAQSVRRGSGYRWRLDQCAPVQYEERDLPIDPYVLGVWIGDGTSTKAEVTCADQPILREIELAGYPVQRASGPIAYRIGGAGHTRDGRTGRYSANSSMSSLLREMGVLGRKRIPREYLQASVAQRRALLEGLMDTDGYVDTLGRCDITTIDLELAEQYAELIASLGHRPLIATKTATLYGKVCGLRHEVTFTPREIVFRLPRKRARQQLTQRFNRGRSIVAVRAVASVPVKCIQVGSEEGTFLITRRFIPTHNSSLGRLGLIVHATAGFVDPGFKGTLTLEITNLTRVPIILWPGKPIAQLSFMALDRPAERPYGHPDLGSHYHGQVEATESRYEGGPANPGPPNPAQPGSTRR